MKEVNVLIVDDEYGYRELLGMKIEDDTGFKVFKADGVKSAIKIMDENHIHFIISDCGIPQNGLNIINEANIRGIPIASMSSDPNKDEETIKKGAKAFFYKSRLSDRWDELIGLIKTLTQLKNEQG